MWNNCRRRTQDYGWQQNSAQIRYKSLNDFGNKSQEGGPTTHTHYTGQISSRQCVTKSYFISVCHFWAEKVRPRAFKLFSTSWKLLRMPKQISWSVCYINVGKQFKINQFKHENILFFVPKWTYKLSPLSSQVTITNFNDPSQSVNVCWPITEGASHGNYFIERIIWVPLIFTNSLHVLDYFNFHSTMGQGQRVLKWQKGQTNWKSTWEHVASFCWTQTRFYKMFYAKPDLRQIWPSVHLAFEQRCRRMLCPSTLRSLGLYLVYYYLIKYYFAAETEAFLSRRKKINEEIPGKQKYNFEILNFMKMFVSNYCSYRKIFFRC